MFSYNTVDEPALEDTPSWNRTNGLLSTTTAVSFSLFFLYRVFNLKVDRILI
jgi:hypothetical protein